MLVNEFVQTTRGRVLTNCHYSRQFCSAALCPDPVDIVNGMVTFTGNSVGETATYTCDPGFNLFGDPTTTCTQVDANSASFQPTPPVCSGEYTA